MRQVSTGHASAEPTRAAGAWDGRPAVVRVPVEVLERTFQTLRDCGENRRECQVLWLSSWHSPELIVRLIHPRHRAHRGGFALESSWLTDCWASLARNYEQIRVQVHSHPHDAFHSATDDAWPIIHTPGFLSLVVPDFAAGEASLDRTYLTMIGADHRWHEAKPEVGLEILR